MFVAGAAFTVSGQHFTYGFAGLIKMGYSISPGLERSLNQLDPAGNQPVKNSLSLFGIEGYAKRQQMIFIVDGYVAAQNIRREGDNYTAPFIVNGNLKLGRIIKETKQYWIYPSLGAGPAATIITHYNREDGSTSIDENYVVLSPVANIGLNADFIIPKLSLTDKEKARLVLGIRIGYQSFFRNRQWRNSNWSRVNGIPSFNNNLYYINASVGEGAFVKKSRVAKS